MGGFAPVSAWTCEDDELLNNAIEAAASLESLGEGAVHFSQSLKDQWHSVEPSPHNIEFVDSASTVSPKLYFLEYKGEETGHKRKMNHDAPECYNPMLKRVRSSVDENRANTQSTNYMYREAKQNHFGSAVSNCESARQHLPNFKTVSAAAATTPINVTESWEFEEVSDSMPKEADEPSAMSMFKLNESFWSETETLVKFDVTSLTYADIDVDNVGDSFKLPQLPTKNAYESISKVTLPERQVEEKESAGNSADFQSAGDAYNFELLGCDVQSDAMDQIPCHNMENLVPSNGNLAGPSAPLMDMTDLEKILFKDNDGNDAANYTNLDSFLLDFNWEEDIANVEHSSIPGGGACNYGQFMNCPSEFAMLRSTPAANPELPTCISDIHILPSAPAAINSELHIACPPEAHLSVPAANSVVHISCVPEAQNLPSTPNVDPELCNGVICCVLNTEDTEIPCNDDALMTLSSRRRSGSSRKHLQHRGIKAYYLAETFKEKPKSSETIQTKKALYEAENIKETPDSSETIQSNILSELGINLPFIKRGD